MTKTTCKICGNSTFKLIGSPRINPNFPRIKLNEYKIYQCKRCKYYFILPEIDLSQEGWKLLYEKNYFHAHNVTKWLQELHRRERIERLSSIERNLKIKKGRFLDLGCGEGFVLNEAALLCFEPFGVDIANNLKAGQSFAFYKGNIFEASFPNNYFSAIYMDSVLEHILNPIETLRELHRILSPGGIMLVIVPNEDSLMNDLAKIYYHLIFQPEKYGRIKPFVVPYHVQGFNERSLVTALMRVGFSIILMKDFGCTYTTWKAHKFGTKNYLNNLLSYPFGLLSVILKRQIQLMALVRKEN